LPRPTLGHRERRLPNHTIGHTDRYLLHPRLQHREYRARQQHWKTDWQDASTRVRERRAIRSPGTEPPWRRDQGDEKKGIVARRDLLSRRHHLVKLGRARFAVRKHDVDLRVGGNAPTPASRSRQNLIHGTPPQTCQIAAPLSQRTRTSSAVSRNAMVKSFDCAPMRTSVDVETA
jgi:hypothetical protein